jgi:glycosyltransferase involved in cell wall biosynthesis
MRIAHFVQRYPPALGGSEAYFARLSRHLVRRGHQVTVFTTTAVDLEAFWSTAGRCLRPGRSWDEGVQVYRHHLWHLPVVQPRILKALSLVPHRPWQLLTIPCNPIAWSMWTEAGRAREQFDVVHATAFPYGWPLACARRLAQRLRAPFVLTPFLHLGDPNDPRDRTRRAYTSPALLTLARSAQRLFLQTEGEKLALLERGFPPERLVLQGMGVDLVSCTGGNRQRARAEWGIGPNEVVIGHLANNSREKGTVDLLKAAEHAWRNGSRFHVVLAGPEMPSFLTFWERYRSTGNVRRLGILDARQKRNFFGAIDIFALPSRSDSFGIVLLEAWANGVPNVGYRAGGIGWVIRDGQDGLLVRCGDVRGLAAALARLVCDEPQRRRLGETGRERIHLEFDWEDKLRLAEEVYRDVVEGAARTAG